MRRKLGPVMTGRLDFRLLTFILSSVEEERKTFFVPHV
jgi:hypothetical protein